MKKNYTKNLFHINSKRVLGHLVIAFLVSNLYFTHAQIPGESYFDNTGYIEYIAGNYPLIISVPHGGYEVPDEIANRDCTGCVYSRDSFTQEVGRSIVQYFHEQTGFYPHVVINLLDRSKLDTNRDIVSGADGDPTGEVAWTNYHDYLETAKNKIIQDFGRGLLIDLHGHGHQIQRIELGYILTRTDLNQTDETLNTQFYINRNSTKNILNDNINLEHAGLVRGPLSFGALIHNKGYPAVPSPADPFPALNDPYFNGGYIVFENGAWNSAEIDAFQIECDQDIRINGGEPAREQFAELCAEAIDEYIILHYGVEDQDSDGFTNVNDCDDNDASINPNVEEIPYNGIDDDCNPDTPDDDLDGDGFSNAHDCDDTNANINPNTLEIPYNGIDDDCNPDTPDDDLDGDGFANADNCDDTNADINPNAVEIPYNGINDDCNPDTPDDDLDGDGFTNADDCDDTNTDINPNAVEIPYNGIDEDCNLNTPDDDLDSDAFANADDCDDTNAAINPNAVETPYNGIDDDCNPHTPDDDIDTDGFMSANDCDDTNASINLNAEEIPYNGIDDDCDPNTPDDDLDGDGFTNADDCNDNNTSINPNAEEVPYNGIDDDCDPNTPNDDLDGDGFTNADDCNDNNTSINPNAEEVPYNGIDDDCDPNTPNDDLDGDGFTNTDDCNDSDASINPNAEEIPYNGIDDDCNPATLDDDFDGDGFLNIDDCDDNNQFVNPNALEILNNEIDDDCDSETTDSVSNEIANPSEEELETVIDGFVVYPNPANQEVIINLPKRINQYEISLFDQRGRLVLMVKNQNVLKVGHLAQGTYTLTLQNLENNISMVKKLLVLR